MNERVSGEGKKSEPAALGPEAAKLVERLESRVATIGVIGLGYVGMPLALHFCEAGCRVIGFDVDQRKLDAIAERRAPFPGVSDEVVAAAVERGFTATGDFARAREPDALMICVPTPLGEHREPDLSFVTGTLASLKPSLRAGQVVSLESTTYPGTTEEEIVPVCTAAGLTVGRDIFVVYAPERENPGRPSFAPADIPRVVSGVTPACLAVGEALYRPVSKNVVPVSTPRAAELAKLLENVFRAVNIGLVNELKVLCHRMGIDVFEVIGAAATKPFGFMPFYPGPGLGGHCIPIDPFYLTWKAKEYGLHTRFIELAGEINSAMPHYVVRRTADALNTRGKAMKGARILLIGLAYKPDVADTRESPTIEILKELWELEAEVQYHDPHLPEFPPTRRLKTVELASVPLTPETIAGFDAVVIVTAHSEVDYTLLLEHAPLIVDTRGVYRGAHPNVVGA